MTLKSNCCITVFLFTLSDQDPTVVIGTEGQSVIISCGTELDIIAASEKHWCRLDSAGFCQPDTIMSSKNKTREEFKILDSHGSFSLEKHQLTHNDSGFYRLIQIFPHQTKACVVELQVKDKPKFLHISPVQDRPKPDKPFEIMCQYSQELQEFWKNWLCDDSECPETVKSVDDRFRSALVLTIDHVACSNIRSFQCLAKTSGSTVRSSVYQKPLIQNPVVNVELYNVKNGTVKVTAYSQLNLICFKPNRYNWDRWDARYNDFYYYDHTYWCSVSYDHCLQVRKNVLETLTSVTLEICVTPNDDGTTYRCSPGNKEVRIVVIGMYNTAD